MSSPLAKPEPAITPDLVAQHGLKPDEYERILSLIGREPTFTELGIVPEGPEAILPTYLDRFRIGGRYNQHAPA